MGCVLERSRPRRPESVEFQPCPGPFPRWHGLARQEPGRIAPQGCSGLEQPHLVRVRNLLQGRDLLRKQLRQRHLHEWREIQNTQDGVQVVRQFQSLLQDGDQHVDTDRDPDLGLDRVLGSAEEALDPKMLFEPAKENPLRMLHFREFPRKRSIFEGTGIPMMGSPSRSWRVAAMRRADCICA